jgi:hypothetical protein
MRVMVYVEGPSDKVAIEATLAELRGAEHAA